MLPAEFTGIDLSPVTPLSTCTAVSCIATERLTALAAEASSAS